MLSVAVSVATAVLTTLAAVTVSYLLFPIADIKIEGAHMFPESQAWEALPKYSSLITLNTEVFGRRIKSNPWVKDVEVIKDWDSGIVTVEVEERKAVLNGDLGDRQVVLAADGTELPSSGGAELKQVGLDEVQLEEIVSVLEVLEENEVTLDSIEDIGAGGVEGTVAGRPVLFSGEVGSLQAQALKGLMGKYPDAPYFDLRSPNRVVVGTGLGSHSIRVSAG